MTAPEFWIIAGINGAGKSTIGSDPSCQNLLGGQSIILNPDLPVPCLYDNLTGISDAEANYAAVVAVEAIVGKRIQCKASIAVETVLSSDKYMKHLETARKGGFLIGMIYVDLPSVELALKRVDDRRRLGGHNVPEDRIRSRWPRSHNNLKKFSSKVDRLYVFSNADPTGKFVLVARKIDDGIELITRGVLPEIDTLLA